MAQDITIDESRLGEELNRFLNDAYSRMSNEALVAHAKMFNLNLSSSVISQDKEDKEPTSDV